MASSDSALKRGLLDAAAGRSVLALSRTDAEGACTAAAFLQAGAEEEAHLVLVSGPEPAWIRSVLRAAGLARTRVTCIPLERVVSASRTWMPRRAVRAMCPHPRGRKPTTVWAVLSEASAIGHPPEATSGFLALAETYGALKVEGVSILALAREQCCCPGAILDALRFHDLVVVGRRLATNRFVVPPSRYARAISSAALLARRMTSLRQTGRASARPPGLTRRETEVLGLIAEGRSNREIAKDLAISPKTADTHRTNLMRKTDIHNVAGLVRYAIAEGIIAPP